MSQQLSISAAFAIFAMAAFTLTATPADDFAAPTPTGATTVVAAPAVDRLLPVFSGVIR